jgi:hypothetical protein
MSKVSITGNASGSGTFTLAAPNSNSDRTLTLPDSTGTILNDQSNIETQVKTATNASGSAPVYSCRAWVNFNGTGTVAIRASGNVSSITDNGTGDYTVNFTTAMPDANYAPMLQAIGGGWKRISTVLSTSVNVLTFNTSNVATDTTGVFVSVHR